MVANQLHRLFMTCACIAALGCGKAKVFLSIPNGHIVDAPAAASAMAPTTITTASLTATTGSNVYTGSVQYTTTDPVFKNSSMAVFITIGDHDSDRIDNVGAGESFLYVWPDSPPPPSGSIPIELDVVTSEGIAGPFEPNSAHDIQVLVAEANGTHSSPLWDVGPINFGEGAAPTTHSGSSGSGSGNCPTLADIGISCPGANAVVPAPCACPAGMKPTGPMTSSGTPCNCLGDP